MLKYPWSFLCWDWPWSPSWLRFRGLNLIWLPFRKSFSSDSLPFMLSSCPTSMRVDMRFLLCCWWRLGRRSGRLSAGHSGSRQAWRNPINYICSLRHCSKTSLWTEETTGSGRRWWRLNICCCFRDFSGSIRCYRGDLFCFSSVHTSFLGLQTESTFCLKYFAVCP